VSVYILLPEDADGALCEWGTYTVGYDCDQPFTWAVIDQSDTSDPSYPEGFHEAHLCDNHIQEASYIYDLEDGA
jgi:hypothetical protein